MWLSTIQIPKRLWLTLAAVIYLMPLLVMELCSQSSCRNTAVLWLVAPLFNPKLNAPYWTVFPLKIIVPHQRVIRVCPDGKCISGQHLTFILLHNIAISHFFIFDFCVMFDRRSGFHPCTFQTFIRCNFSITLSGPYQFSHLWLALYTL